MQRKKLRLSQETVRVLTANDLDRVGGGISRPCPSLFPPCPTDPPKCATATTTTSP